MGVYQISCGVRLISNTIVDPQRKAVFWISCSTRNLICSFSVSWNRSMWTSFACTSVQFIVAVFKSKFSYHKTEHSFSNHHCDLLPGAVANSSLEWPIYIWIYLLSLIARREEALRNELICSWEIFFLAMKVVMTNHNQSTFRRVRFSIDDHPLSGIAV